MIAHALLMAALGPTVDVAYLSSDFKAGNGLPASYAFTSTLDYRW